MHCAFILYSSYQELRKLQPHRNEEIEKVDNFSSVTWHTLNKVNRALDQRWANNSVFVFDHKLKPEYYSYLYSSKNLGPNIIRIRIRPKIWVRILFVFVFGYFENTNIIRLSIRPPIYRTGVNKKPFTWYNPTSLEFNYDTQFQRFLVWQTLIGVADSNGPSGIVLIYTEFDNWTKCGQNLPLSFRLAIKLSYRVFFL